MSIARKQQKIAATMTLKMTAKMVTMLFQTDIKDTGLFCLSRNNCHLYQRIENIRNYIKI